eukprot:859505-Pelagomonas_calceolata.AAC.1
MQLPFKQHMHGHACNCRIRGNGEVIRRDEFEQRKEAAEQARQARLNKKPKKLASQGKNVEEFPLLQTHTQVQLAQAKAQLAHVKMQLAEAKVQLAWRSSITVSTHYSGFGSRKILLDLTFRLYGLGLLPISLFGPNLLGKSAKCLRMQTKIAQPGHDGVQSHSANVHVFK